MSKDGDAGSVQPQHLSFDATIDGATYTLEAMLYIPQDGKAKHPLIVLTHGQSI